MINVCYLYDDNNISEGYTTPGWYFWDETYLFVYGPYETEKLAKEKMREYAKSH